MHIFIIKFFSVVEQLQQLFFFPQTFAKMKRKLLIQLIKSNLLPFLVDRFIQESFENSLACSQSWKDIFCNVFFSVSKWPPQAVVIISTE